MPPHQARRRAAPLTAEEILRAAVALVEAGGESALSMRQLGANLSVDPMAVYGHFASKSALLDALSADLFRAVLVGYDPSAPGRVRVWQLVHGLRRVVISRPNVSMLAFRRSITISPQANNAPWQVTFSLLYDALDDAGLPPSQVAPAAWAISSCARGLIHGEITVLVTTSSSEPTGEVLPLLDPGPAGDTAREDVYTRTLTTLIDALLPHDTP